MTDTSAADDNRINVSVSVECVNIIDEAMRNSKLYNTRADFVFSAVREFYRQCIGRFHGYIRQVKAEGETPYERVAMFDEATLRYGEFMLDSYSKSYKGSNIRQIPIRPNSKFREELDKLTMFLFNSKTKEDVILTCRAAIFWYIGEVNKDSRNHDDFESSLADMRAEVKKNRIDIGV